jgi:N-acetylmuramoyl-L-alanine amidase
MLAWAGLLLMLASVMWWQFLPEQPRVTHNEPFTVPQKGQISRVVIDPGHGGNDSGTMRSGVLEKDLTLDVARRLDQLVRARGLTSVLTRAGDETVSLPARAATANQERDCLFVSIHFDEGSRAAATGVQTYYAARQSPKTPLAVAWLPFLQPRSGDAENVESQSLAGFIQDALVVRTEAFNRGTRAEQFYVIANVQHPAVLVEGGFLTNNDDITKLASEEYRQRLAVGIADGIMRYREVARQARPALVVEEAAP